MKNKNLKILENDVNELKLNSKIYSKLIDNNIDTIGKLCNYTRGDLRNLDFVHHVINLVGLTLITFSLIFSKWERLKK